MFGTKPSSYRNKIGNLQGGDYAFFNDTTIQAESMENFLKSMFTLTEQAIDGSVLENSLFSPVYGYHAFSAPTGNSLCSMKFGYPSVGMRLVLDFGQCAGDANISIFASTGGGVTGVSVILATGSELSTVLMSAGGRLEAVCLTEGTWSIVSANASITFQAGS